MIKGGSMHYILDEANNAIPCPNTDEWVTWYKDNEKRRCTASEAIGEVLVSTVFLSLNHGSVEKPMLWETMIFGGKHDQAQKRYGTHAEALEGHNLAVKNIKASQNLIEG